jgi:hypothetical protein
MTEPAVVLTDYGLAIEAALFTYLICRRAKRRSPLGNWLAIFFGSISLATLMGGTVHGFFTNEQTPGYAVLWPASLIAVGVTALSIWAIGADLVFSPNAARRATAAAAVGFAAYSAAVLLVTREFWIAIAAYLPAALFLLVALAVEYRRAKHRQLAAGIAGLGLTFVAAAVQRAGISIHPDYFDHNALYHVIQGVALLMIFSSARFLTGQERFGGAYADKT